MGDKIVIIGNSGGGKSILASKLSEVVKIPIYKLDKLQWNPGWVPTPSEKFNELHDDILTKPKWIIDGFASWESIEKRFKAANTIIFVDHSIIIHLWWALKRQFFCLFRPRPDFVDGCPMIPMTGKLIKMILEIDKLIKPKILKLLKEYKDGKDIYHIKSPKELRIFTKKYCMQTDR
jgi:adenylate kinase family enzyme